MARHHVERSDRYCHCGWVLEMPTHILRPDAYPDVRHRPAREVAARCPESESLILGPFFAEKVAFVWCILPATHRTPANALLGVSWSCAKLVDLSPPILLSHGLIVNHIRAT